jgi:hypothetical protein
MPKAYVVTSYHSISDPEKFAAYEVIELPHHDAGRAPVLALEDAQTLTRNHRRVG